MKKSLIKACNTIAVNDLTRLVNNPNQRFFHWTFVISGNKLVGVGRNRRGENQFKNFGYLETANLHSEQDAYWRTKGLLTKKQFQVLNIRLNKQGNLMLSKPCPCCFRFLTFFGCEQFYYSTKNGFDKIQRKAK